MINPAITPTFLQQWDKFYKEFIESSIYIPTNQTDPSNTPMITTANDNNDAVWPMNIQQPLLTPATHLIFSPTSLSAHLTKSDVIIGQIEWTTQYTPPTENDIDTFAPKTVTPTTNPGNAYSLAIWPRGIEEMISLDITTPQTLDEKFAASLVQLQAILKQLEDSNRYLFQLLQTLSIQALCQKPSNPGDNTLQPTTFPVIQTQHVLDQVIHRQPPPAPNPATGTLHPGKFPEPQPSPTSKITPHKKINTKANVACLYIWTKDCLCLP